MNPGDIYLDDAFVFSDGTVGRKLFILLNRPTSGPYLVVKTTSKGQRYAGAQTGCNEERAVFFLRKSYFKESFPEDTYIQLAEIFEYESFEFVRKGQAGQLKQMGTLKEQSLNALINCLKRLREDIRGDHYKAITGK